MASGGRAIAGAGKGRARPHRSSLQTSNLILSTLLVPVPCAHESKKTLSFQWTAFQDLEPPTKRFLLIANLPYGEQLVPAPSINCIGKSASYKPAFSKWRVALLVPNAAPIHLLALKTTTEISLLNGALPVKLLIWKDNFAID